MFALVFIRHIMSLFQNRKKIQDLERTCRELAAQKSEHDDYVARLESNNHQLCDMQAEFLQNNLALSEANARLASLATTDGLTGIANHRAFQERLHAEMSLSIRHGSPIALLLMDVDHFKQYNDAYGHPAGDDVLRTLAGLINESVRSGDVAARYGGEEFAVIMPHTAACDARTVAERVRENVAKYRFEHRNVTISLGIACSADGAQDCEQLVVQADEALYQAKRNGRNRVSHFGEIDAPNLDATSAEDQTLTISETVCNGVAGAEWGGLEGLLQEPAGQILYGLLTALDLRDAETEGHSQRVARFALRLAAEANQMELINLTPSDLRELCMGALLHDIGKIGIQDSILRKPGRLNDEERNLMRKHPDMGIQLLANFPVLRTALPVVRSHHERWDGMGYPDGLASECIPLAARIFSIADTLDAMSSRSVYRQPQSYQAVRTELERLSGKQFDPNLVHAFLNIPEQEWMQIRSGCCGAELQAVGTEAAQAA